MHRPILHRIRAVHVSYSRQTVTVIVAIGGGAQEVVRSFRLEKDTHFCQWSIVAVRNEIHLRGSQKCRQPMLSSGSLWPTSSVSTQWISVESHSGGVCGHELISTVFTWRKGKHCKQGHHHDAAKPLDDHAYCARSEVAYCGIWRKLYDCSRLKFRASKCVLKCTLVPCS